MHIVTLILIGVGILLVVMLLYSSTQSITQDGCVSSSIGQTSNMTCPVYDSTSSTCPDYTA